MIYLNCLSNSFSGGWIINDFSLGANGEATAQRLNRKRRVADVISFLPAKPVVQHPLLTGSFHSLTDVITLAASDFFNYG
jgi:hypothetical protein